MAGDTGEVPDIDSDDEEEKKDTKEDKGKLSIVII